MSGEFIGRTPDEGQFTAHTLGKQRLTCAAGKQGLVDSPAIGSGPRAQRVGLKTFGPVDQHRLEPRHDKSPREVRIAQLGRQLAYNLRYRDRRGYTLNTTLARTNQRSRSLECAGRRHDHPRCALDEEPGPQARSRDASDEERLAQMESGAYA